MLGVCRFFVGGKIEGFIEEVVTYVNFNPPFNGVFCGDSVFFKVFPKALDVICVNAEDVEGFKLWEVGGLVSVLVCTAFE